MFGNVGNYNIMDGSRYAHLSISQWIFIRLGIPCKYYFFVDTAAAWQNFVLIKGAAFDLPLGVGDL